MQFQQILKISKNYIYNEYDKCDFDKLINKLNELFPNQTKYEIRNK